MLSLNNIKPNSGSRKKLTRVGRGNGSKGTFCGRGMNGQNCRSGGGVPDWFEGGQTPLFRRMPKLKGFSNFLFKKEYNIINLKDLEKLSKLGIDKIDEEILFEKRILRKKNLPIKLLGDGELTGKVTITVNSVSPKAKESVEKVGGNVELI